MFLKEKIEDMEKKYILRIYQLLLAILLINPLFYKFISNTTILRACELACFLYAIYCLYKLFVKRKLVIYRGYVKILLVALMLVSIGIVMRGDWPSTIKDVLLVVISPTQTLVYILPFIILFLPNQKYFNEILHLFYKASLFAFVLWAINVGDLVQVGTHKGEAIGAFFPFFSAFLLGLLPAFTKRQQCITISIWLIFFLLMLLNARRNVSFSLALYALIAYVVSIISNIKKNPIKYFLILICSFIGLIILQINLNKLASGTFSNMAHRASLDTRSGVEELFFLDFYNSPVEDWIFGRGMDGGYRQSVVDEATGEVSEIRNVIETGYLNMLLKGGILYIVLVLLLMFYALSKGFKSKHKECIYISLILSTYLIDLYTTNPVCAYSVRSIIFWFCISVLLDVKVQKNAIYLKSFKYYIQK